MRGLSWLLWLAGAGLAAAEGERPGDFDYYLLALSWSPTWCALEGDSRGADQCDARHDYAWTLHGLWPQNERGWPSFCPAAGPGPAAGEVATMTEIMGSAGLARYQWEKHGSCSGLEPEAYFAAARSAYQAVKQPDALRRLDRTVEIDPEVVEEAFLAANPGLSEEGLVLSCRSGRISEVRICLTRDLTFRRCAPDIADDCRGMARLDPVR